MMRLEILDHKNRIVSAHKLDRGLTLLGNSPGAHVHLNGKGIGALHIAIKAGPKPVVMDLGGPTPLRVDGKETIEHELTQKQAMLEIGEQRIRILNNGRALTEIRNQPWVPVTDAKSKTLYARVRVYVKGMPQEAVNTREAFKLSEHYGLPEPFKMVWFSGQKAFAQLPSQWISLGGRLQLGKDRIGKLADWTSPTELEQDTVYRVHAGVYVVEILISKGALIIGAARPDLFPKEFRKPFTVSLGSVLIVFALWLLVFGKPNEKVEEPYPVYARIQNIPVEKMPEPEPSSEPQAGGGTGSEATTTTAPQQGTPAQSAPSKLAANLTGGLKNLVGNLLSNTKVSNTVMAENGTGGLAAAAGGANTQVGKLAAVGNGVAATPGATSLGKLALAGTGKGFNGGSGTGLGTGHGAGIGTGVGNGIGRGGFRLVEEESIVDGGLDKSVIAAVIQNNLGQIKYCYERQLVAEPDLFGKVVVLWQINAAGNVESPSVKQTTLNSPPVEQCMLTKIAGWKFPQPKNGTKVTVTYPFLFKSTK